MHARDDEKEVLLTWELLHVRGEGKKGRQLMTISISINYGIIISVSALSALLIQQHQPDTITIVIINCSTYAEKASKSDT